jgi:hypothetical protein
LKVQIIKKPRNIVDLSGIFYKLSQKFVKFRVSGFEFGGFSQLEYFKEYSKGTRLSRNLFL